MIAADRFGDGYTEHGFIAAVAGEFEALRFTYRPAIGSHGGRQRNAFLLEHLVAWDRNDERGNEIPITPAALAALPPAQFAKLHAIVSGRVASDIDPAWSVELAERLAEARAEAAATGRTIGEVRQEHDEKN